MTTENDKNKRGFEGFGSLRSSLSAEADPTESAPTRAIDGNHCTCIDASQSAKQRKARNRFERYPAPPADTARFEQCRRC